MSELNMNKFCDGFSLRYIEHLVCGIADAITELERIKSLPNCNNCVGRNKCEFVPDFTDQYPVRIFCPLHVSHDDLEDDYMADYQPLSPETYAALDKAIEALKSGVKK